MKVSIITVTYNSIKTIERTILSVLNQSYKDIEYILIDGNSDDGTINIIKSYEYRINKFISENDKGIYDAMNKGLEIASGDIICFLNSDDIYSNNFIISEVISQFNENTNIDIIYGDIFFFRDNIDKIVRYYSSKHFNYKKLKFGLMPAHQAMFIKKTIFTNYGNFSLNYKIAGDFDWVARVFKNNQINYKYIPVVLVRMQVGGISTNGLKSKITIFLETMRSCKNNDIKTNYIFLFMKYIFKLVHK